MENRRYRGGLIWPVILVGAGVVLLLNNLGVLPWNVWGTLFRLWPVLLITVGLEILIGRRSLLGSVVVAVLLVVVLVLAVIPGVLPQDWQSGSGADRTEMISEELDGAARAEVEIAFGVGTLEVGALPEGDGHLMQGQVDLNRNERLVLDHSRSGDRAQVRLGSENGWTVAPVIAPGNRTWRIGLSREIPISLRIGAGAGVSTLDLAGLDLSNLRIDSSVGRATIKLPARGRFDVYIEGGVGEITIIVPEALAARLRVSEGIGGVTVDGDFERTADETISPDFDTAQDRVDIKVDGGVGRIVLREAVE